MGRKAKAADCPSCSKSCLWSESDQRTSAPVFLAQQGRNNCSPQKTPPLQNLLREMNSRWAFLVTVALRLHWSMSPNCHRPHTGHFQASKPANLYPNQKGAAADFARKKTWRVEALDREKVVMPHPRYYSSGFRVRPEEKAKTGVKTPSNHRRSDSPTSHKHAFNPGKTRRVGGIKSEIHRRGRAWRKNHLH